MRQKTSDQIYPDFSNPSTSKLVLEYRAKYEAIDQVLEANRTFVNLVHRELEQVLSTSNKGRKSEYTSENFLRVLVVMFVEGTSYRDTIIRVEESEFLRDFARLGFKQAMDFTLLSRAFCALSQETWQLLNRKLAQYAAKQEQIGGNKLRLDTTVVESNIHYPTDATLLWDSYRTLVRLLRELKLQLPTVRFTYRFHDRKSKRQMHFLSRHAKSPSKHTQKRVRRTYRRLIDDVQRVLKLVAEVLPHVPAAHPLAEELVHYQPLVARVIDQAERRVFKGEMLPADEKLYSIFEPHTELLKRGKAGKPIEFGHMVLIGQTREKFISQYEVMAKREADVALVDRSVKAHERLFGQGTLEVLAADKGFYESMEKLSELEERIATVSIAKKGKRTEEQTARETTDEFKEGQRFRAGVEGSISVLKRAFKQGRCLFKGFKNFAASVGCAVFCHNLVLLSRL